MGEPSRRGFLTKATGFGCAGISVITGCSRRNLSGMTGPNSTSPSPPSSASSTETVPSRPKRIPLSEYSDIQEAIDDAEDFDTIMIDVDYTFTETIRLKSNLKVQGDGGRLRMDDGADTHGLRTEDVHNVWINDVTIDGNRANNGTGRIIGGFNVGTISNIRVTNCTIENAGLHAINFSNDKRGEMKDIYIGNNVIKKPFSHGILCGGKGSDPNSLHDMIIENNEITDAFNAQSIGVFGQDECDTFNVAILGNTCLQNLKQERNDDTAIAFEEQVRDSIGYGNVVRMSGKDENGFSVTKDAKGCIVGNNRIRNCQFGMACMNLDFYMPDGPPQHNLFTHNEVDNCRAGFHYRNLQGNLMVYYNRMTNVEELISKSNNSGGGYNVSRNGPSVPERETGPPNQIGSGVDYSVDGEVVGEAQWSRGGNSPYEPVSVRARTLYSR